MEVNAHTETLLYDRSFDQSQDLSLLYFGHCSFHIFLEVLDIKLRVLLLTLFLCVACSCSNIPAEAVTPSNAGFAGLWECPTAQMPGDGQGWIGWSEYYPYRPYYVTLGYFPWLEWNLRLTRFATGPDINASYGSYHNGYGKYKDKAMDLKFLLLSQDGLMPGVAVGVTDILGTKLMRGYYAVATWEMEKWAFSMGYGTDRYNGFFGGISWEPFDWLELKAEYSPLDYSLDGTDSWKVHPEEAKSKYNYGLVIRTPWNLNATISRQRDEEWCYGFSYTFDLSKPIFGHREKKFYRPESEEITLPDWDKTDLPELGNLLVERIGEKVAVRDVNVLIGDRRILVAYENIGYSSQSEALARVLVLLSNLAPWDVEEVSVVPMVRGRAITRVDFPGYQMALLRLGSLNAADARGTVVRWAPADGRFGTLKDEKWNIICSPGRTVRKGLHEVRIALAWELRIDRTLYEDYMDRWSIDYSYKMRSSQGWEFYTDVRQPIENDIEIWWQPEANDKTRIWQSALSYLLKIDDDTYALAEAGWLDDLWFGGNLWLRKYFDNGRLWIGSRASYVHLRDPESFAGLSDTPRAWETPGSIIVGGSVPYRDGEWWLAWLVQAGYSEPLYDVDLMAEVGKFIDGDRGYRLSIMRHWDDLGFGFYYTDTDRNAPGKDFTDAGMKFEIPADVLFGQKSSTVWRQDPTLLSTWNYYSGRMPGCYRSPEELMGQLRPERLRGNLYKALDRYDRQFGEEELFEEARGNYSLYDYITGNYRLKQEE